MPAANNILMKRTSVDAHFGDPFDVNRTTATCTDTEQPNEHTMHSEINKFQES